MDSTNPFLAATATPEPTPAPDNPFLAAVQPKRLSKQIDNSLGKTLVNAHNDPIRAFTNGLETLQRGVEALVVGKNPWEAITNPQERDEL